MSNILIVSNTDGAHYVFRGWFIEKLIEEGHSVDSLTLRLSPEDIYKEKIEAISKEYYRNEVKKINIVNLIKSFKLIRGVLKRKKYDIIHLYGHEAFIFFLPFINSNERNRVVVTITGLGRLFSSEANFFVLCARKLLFYLYEIQLNKISNLIFLNRDDASVFDASIICAEKSVIIRGEGYDVKTVKRQNRSLLKYEKIKVLFASRFLIEKGILILLESIKKTTNMNLQFIFAGSIPEKMKNNVMISELLDGKINNSIYIGYVEDMPQLMNEIDVVILPTFYNEGAPRVLIEALYAGKFIITTDVAGAKETVVNKFNGIICERKSVQSIVTALNNININCVEKAKIYSNRHYNDFYSSARIYQDLKMIYFGN